MKKINIIKKALSISIVASIALLASACGKNNNYSIFAKEEVKNYAKQYNKEEILSNTKGIREIVDGNSPTYNTLYNVFSTYSDYDAIEGVYKFKLFSTNCDKSIIDIESNYHINAFAITKYINYMQIENNSKYSLYDEFGNEVVKDKSTSTSVSLAILKTTKNKNNKTITYLETLDCDGEKTYNLVDVEYEKDKAIKCVRNVINDEDLEKIYDINETILDILSNSDRTMISLYDEYKVMTVPQSSGELIVIYDENETFKHSIELASNETFDVVGNYLLTQSKTLVDNDFEKYDYELEGKKYILKTKAIEISTGKSEILDDFNYIFDKNEKYPVYGTITRNNLDYTYIYQLGAIAYEINEDKTIDFIEKPIIIDEKLNIKNAKYEEIGYISYIDDNHYQLYTPVGQYMLNGKANVLGFVGDNDLQIIAPNVLFLRNFSSGKYAFVDYDLNFISDGFCYKEINTTLYRNILGNRLFALNEYGLDKIIKLKDDNTFETLKDLNNIEVSYIHPEESYTLYSTSISSCISFVQGSNCYYDFYLDIENIDTEDYDEVLNIEIKNIETDEVIKEINNVSSIECKKDHITFNYYYDPENIYSTKTVYIFF